MKSHLNPHCKNELILILIRIQISSEKNFGWNFVFVNILIPIACMRFMLKYVYIILHWIKRTTVNIMLVKKIILEMHDHITRDF